MAPSLAPYFDTVVFISLTNTPPHTETRSLTHTITQAVSRVHSTPEGVRYIPSHAYLSHILPSGKQTKRLRTNFWHAASEHTSTQPNFSLTGGTSGWSYSVYERAQSCVYINSETWKVFTEWTGKQRLKRRFTKLFQIPELTGHESHSNQKHNMC